jgi:hypothetical protein
MPMSRPVASTSAPPELPGLMEASVVHAEAGAADRGDDAHGRGDADLERIPDCKNKVARLHSVAVRHGERLEPVGFDLQQREVGGGIEARQPGVKPPVVVKLDDDGVGHPAARQMNNMAVRDDPAVGAEDHSRADALHALAVTRLFLPIVRFVPSKKTVEQIVAFLLFMDKTRGKNRHHCGRHARQQSRVTSQGDSRHG